MIYKNALPFFHNEDIDLILNEFREILTGNGMLTKGPRSKEFEKKEFVDSYRYINKDEGYTWPSETFYKNEPNQRIDIIYVKGMKIINSKTYHTDKWMSDHKMVITRILI